MPDQRNGVFTFVGEAIRNYRVTGSPLPSWGGLGREMTRPVRAARGPKRILEVGPGTGPFTKLVLGALGDGDALHVVEINPTFCDQLERQLLEPFRREHPEIEVVLHCAPIEDAPLEGKFDFIVCSLPFNNFPVAAVQSIFLAMLDRLAPDGDLTYFEYIGMRAMKAPLVGSSGRRSLRRREALQKVLLRRHRGSRSMVLRNFPPAYAIHLRA